MQYSYLCSLDTHLEYSSTEDQHYYHMLWISKYQRVSKCSFLRDLHTGLADLHLDISPIYNPIANHKRNKKIPLGLLCDLANITGEYSKFD